MKDIFRLIFARGPPGARPRRSGFAAPGLEASGSLSTASPATPGPPTLRCSVWVATSFGRVIFLPNFFPPVGLVQALRLCPPDEHGSAPNPPVQE